MYDELIKALRCYAKDEECYHCKYFSEVSCDIDRMLFDAADAIEELLRKEKFHAFLWNVINPNDMQLYLEMYHSGDEKQEVKE